MWDLNNTNTIHEANKTTLWTPRRRFEEELIDEDQPLEDFRACFTDIQTANRLFGGWRVILKHLSGLIGNEKGPLTVLDVATGYADIPRAILRWGLAHGRRFKVTGLDANDKVLRIAEDASSGVADLSFIRGDARNLPFSDGSFDFVLSSLTFHHFDDPTAARVLQEMARVGRRGVVVNDLRRGYIPAALIWIVTRVLGMNRLTKNDAPLSVLRSRTISEYRDLANLAGFPEAEVYKHPFWRAAIVIRRADEAG